MRRHVLASVLCIAAIPAAHAAPDCSGSLVPAPLKTPATVIAPVAPEFTAAARTTGASRRVVSPGRAFCSSSSVGSRSSGVGGRSGSVGSGGHGVGSRGFSGRSSRSGSSGNRPPDHVGVALTTECAAPRLAGAFHQSTFSTVPRERPRKRSPMVWKRKGTSLTTKR